MPSAAIAVSCQPIVPTPGISPAQFCARIKKNRQISNGNAAGNAFFPRIGSKISLNIPMTVSIAYCPFEGISFGFPQARRISTISKIATIHAVTILFVIGNENPSQSGISKSFSAASVAAEAAGVAISNAAIQGKNFIKRVMSLTLSDYAHGNVPCKTSFPLPRKFSKKNTPRRTNVQQRNLISDFLLSSRKAFWQCERQTPRLFLLFFTKKSCRRLRLAAAPPLRSFPFLFL